MNHLNHESSYVSNDEVDAVLEDIAQRMEDYAATVQEAAEIIREFKKRK